MVCLLLEIITNTIISCTLAQCHRSNPYYCVSACMNTVLSLSLVKKRPHKEKVVDLCKHTTQRLLTGVQCFQEHNNSFGICVSKQSVKT